ncbi:MAG: hypothetical protein L3K01_06880 [Thermoplasmata archaeon]|nr:hypothetical protein [Thermoplasmata archaeon]
MPCVFCGDPFRFADGTAIYYRPTDPRDPKTRRPQYIARMCPNCRIELDKEHGLIP